MRYLSRRAFLAASAATSFLTAPLRSAEKVKRKVKYIDIHTHLGTFYWGRPLPAEGLLRLMDKHDIEKAVVLPLVSPEAAPYVQTSEAALAAHKAHPDRIIAFCAVDPR